MYSWISPKIEKRFGKFGLGMFAKDSIAKDEIVIVQGGRTISSIDFNDPKFESVWYHAFQVEQDVYIYPCDLNHGAFDGVFIVNHSCEPSCGFRGQVTMISLKDITPGEEISFDYAMTDVKLEGDDWEPMECLCGSKNCRNLITGDDWKLPQVRIKYKGYFSQYVQNLIDAELEPNQRGRGNFYP